MKVSKELKKEEAIKRMKKLGLFEPCVRAFKNRDEVQLTEMTGGLYEFNSDLKLNEMVNEFEKEYNSLVYHVIHTFTEFGELYNLLYVSDHEEEWEYENEDLKDGYVFSYVINKDVPEFSEFGSIVVRNKFGGLVRIG